MIKIHFILTISISLTLISCKNSTHPKDNIITVNVTNKYPHKELYLQDIFDVEYIPLETNDEFITTASPQDITKDIILFKDLNRVNTGNIFIFRRDGKGLIKINHLGQGAEEYVYPLGVIFDEEKEELFVNDIPGKKIVVYDLNGNFKRNFKQKEGIYYDKIDNFNQNYLICNDGYWGINKSKAKRNYFMLVSKQDGSIKEIPIPYQKKIYPMVEAQSTTGRVIYAIYNMQQIPLLDSWILMEPSSDTIYSYTQDHILKPFIVRSPSIQSMDIEVFLYLGAITDRYYFMQTVKKEFDVENETGFPTKELMYDRDEGVIYECFIYNADFDNKKPISMVYERPIVPAIINNEEVSFITRLEAHDLIEAYEKGKLKGRLKEIAAELDEDSNPVIMIAKHKNRND